MSQDPREADDLPPVHVPSGSANGWRWAGFALVICGLAGLLFHLNEEVPVLQSHLGQVSIGLIVLGLVLIVAGAFVRPRGGGPPPAAG
jgi:hypothetical protein